MFKTLKTIILSRLTKPKEDEEVLRKRKICKGCEYNSLNIEKIPIDKLVLKKVSRFYSYITGNEDDDVLGECFGCKSCSIFYKTAYENECPKGYWNKNCAKEIKTENI